MNVKEYGSRLPTKLTSSEIEALKRFPQLAREFCRFIEEADGCDRDDLIQDLSISLAGLCQVAAQLPNVEPATEGADYTQEEIENHGREYARVSALLRAKLGGLDVFWEVYDPTEESKPIQFSLANNVAEIYLDLKDSLAPQSATIEVNDLYWQWRADFRSHWSRHAASALKVTLFLMGSV